MKRIHGYPCTLFRKIAFFFLGLFTLVYASSHREAPVISTDPLADITDVYAFVSPDDATKVTLIMNVIPLQDPNGGPNFFKFGDDVLYVLNIDNDGDAIPDIQYEFRFTTTVLNGNTFLYNVGPINALNDANQNIQQTFSVTKVENGVSTVLGSGLATPPVNVGPASVPDYASLASAAVHNLGSTTVYAGQRDDPFYVDLGAVFDLLTIRPGAPGNMGGGIDQVAGLNVHTIAVQVPKTDLDGGEDIIGVWATTFRQAMNTINTDGSRVASGSWVQVSRLGLPLINEVVIPLAQKDLFNASQPVDDVANFATPVLEPEVPVLLNLLYGLSVPPTPRNDLLNLLTGFSGLNQPASVTPSDQIRLNMNISPTGPGDVGFSIFGVLDGDLSGYPNGRRLEDDVVAISLRAMAGVLVPGFNIFPNNALDDGVHFNDLPFLDQFPYVALPHSGFEHTHHKLSGPPAPIVTHQFVFLADRDIRVSAAIVGEGDMHANDDLDILTGNPSTYNGNLSAVDDVEVRRDNTVNGDVLAGDDLDNDGTINGTASGDAGVAPIPLAALMPFDAGDDNITLSADETLALAPGAYRNVEVQRRANLQLTSGKYFFRSLETLTDAIITMDVTNGPVIVNVTRSIEFGPSSEVIITPEGELGSSKVTFNSLHTGTLYLLSGAKVLGNIIAPDARVKILSESAFRGSICARDITVNRESTILHHSSALSLPKVTASADLAGNDGSAIPAAYELAQNYPNPFNPSTTIQFAVPAAEQVTLKIYNITGQLIKTLVNDNMDAGFHQAVWNGSDLHGNQVASGMYFYRLQAGEFHEMKKMFLLK